MPLHPVEPDRFRAVMGHFATGVAVVTATGPEGPVGHDRERGLLAVAGPAAAARLLRQRRAHAPRGARHRALRRQRAGGRPGAVARRFASKLPEARSSPASPTRSRTASPCSRTRSPGSAAAGPLLPAGDHTIGIGAVQAAETGPRRDPLIWFRGGVRTASRDRRPHRARRRARASSTSPPALLGACGPGGTGDPAPAFWPLLRAGQALVVVEALDGLVLLLSGQELPSLHLVYGLDAARRSRSSPSSCG